MPKIRYRKAGPGVREWIWLHRAVMFPAAALLAFPGALLIYRASGAPWPLAVFSTLFNNFLWIVLLYLYLRRNQTRKRSLEKMGTIVHLRYPGSPPGSLPDRWAEGTATCRPGKIVFQEVLSGTDVLLGKPTELDVLAGTGPSRAAIRRWGEQLPPGVKVLTLAISHGTVEIAAEPSALEKLEEQVLQSGTTT